ncbi:MAG: hypothetical protein JNK10_04920 [Cyclobacteriaceae bacterium]|nr:hypothetical protein [Cyclobacteriaceae bacterium]
MDVKALDKALLEIIKARQELTTINYNNPQYDDLEEKLHDLEDDFQETYGDELERALQDIHDEYCPDSDVLVPIAYIAKKYQVSANNEYSVANTEGVFVEMDDYPGKDTKLALLPNPTRIVLSIGSEKQQVVWTAK